MEVMARLFALVAAERERQEKKFGEKNTGRPLSRYVAIINEEFGEMTAEVNDLLEEVDTWEIHESGLSQAQYETMKASFDRVEEELVQTMACLALLHSNLRAGTYQLS